MTPPMRQEPERPHVGNDFCFESGVTTDPGALDSRVGECANQRDGGSVVAGKGLRVAADTRPYHATEAHVGS